MTNKELEKRILNLEKQLSILAKRTSNRNNTNESSINKVEGETKSLNTALSDGIWNDTKIYSVEEYVMYSNSLYKCLISNKGITPVNSNYWEHTNVANELNKLKEAKE